MNKITLLFAALMMTLGVSAQEGTTVEERGAAKGYYPFAAEVTEMEQITSLDQLTDGMEIMIKHSHEGTDQNNHEGSYLTIYSLPTYGAAHIVFMQEKPVEVGVWTTETVSAEDGTLKLLSAHGVITNSSCYLGQLGWNLTAEAYLSTTGTAEYVGVYKFVPATDGSGRWNIQCTNNKSKTYLSVTADSKGNPTISEAYYIDKNCYFDIYRVTEKSEAQVKYVEDVQVHLIGPSGNIVTTTHTGWNDFYEFIMYSGNAQNSVNYGISISNVLYHENQNQITASIKYAFPISGNVAKIPVHLCPKGSENLRISIVDGNLKVVEKPANGWVKDKNNQWYIFPKYDNKDFTYAIQNVGTGQYINFTSTYTSSNIITLGQTPSYFTLGANTTGTYLNFEFKYTNDKSATYTYCLYGDIQDLKVYNNLLIPAYQLGAYSKNSYYTAENFLVPAVSAAELDGVPAIGFTRYFHEDTYFWDGGEIADEKVPDAVKANRGSTSHEGYNKGTHKVYSAETGIIVTQTGTVTAQFDYISGQNALQILGVDIVTKDANKTVVSFDYHLGKAGTPSQGNLYLLENVEEGEYLLRYWVCNRTDLEGWDGHNLKNVRGKIQVRGANYNLLKSEAPSADAFHANTTWFRMRLCDGLEKYISAQPAYTDWHNNLKLSNNTPPTDYAGLWCVVGDEENGYKIYNRAWGPAYALTTTGDEESARTYMTDADDAVSYDIVQEEDSYKYYVKVHGVTDKYLNDRGGYLATWNTSYALGNEGSVMTFETVNEEVFEANTVTVENELKNSWAPWMNVNSDFSNAYNNNSTFASWVLGRQQLAELLNGKVFKFANKGGDDRNGRILGIDANGTMLGMEPSQQEGGNINEFVQLNHNGDGTYNLLHLATNKYFDLPQDDKTAVADVNSAAKYSFANYAEDPTAALFAVSNTHLMNLGDGNSRSYKLTNWNGHPEDGASRWTVTFDEDAQALAELIKEAKARYAATQEDAYQANVGVPGYANAESTTELLNTFNGGLAGMTFAAATTALTDAMNGVTTAERTAVYPTDCYFTITNCGTTNDPRNLSVIYDASKAGTKDLNDGVSEFLWHNTSALDKNNPDHLWCFYRNEKNGQHYLYNVGKKQFASPTGKGDYGLTWIFSDTPVAITMTDLGAETPTFHIKGGNETMSVSTGYAGSVITWYSNGDAGVPFTFEKSEYPFDESVLAAVSPKLAPGFYTLKCGNSYLSDDRFTGDTTRSMTEEGEGTPGIKNIFYNTKDNALVGFASGFGFVFATCNTGKPEDGYNTFEYGYGDETGTFTVKSQQGTATSAEAWNAGRYFKKDGEKLLYTTNLKDADSWTIEAVTELPVKLSRAQNETGAYGTIWSPVALEIPEGITAYTGRVTSECELVLEAITGGVIPAETGVVLWNEKAEGTYVQNLKITDAEATAVSGDNKFVGWALTKANPNTKDGDYYSLGIKNNNMAFYRYVGQNLQGFRARIEKGDAPANASALTMRFNNATGIEEVISAFQNGAVYDLSGRRVATPTKGVYIVNGKKVFIK